MTGDLIFAIDPGNTESGYVITDMDLKPITFGKIANEKLLNEIRDEIHHAGRHGQKIYFAVEMIASYGMPVGKEVFDTCLWIGRFLERIHAWNRYNVIGQPPVMPELIYRKDEKLTICSSPRANDATIRQALVDRFAPGESNYGKGTKKAPGWFYGFRADIWQAYAVAVTYHDMYLERSNE